MKRSKVFISYAREDFAFANQVFDALNDEFSPWMDKRSLIAGEDWERAISAAAQSSDFFVFCASKNSVAKRGAVQKEIKIALEEWRGRLQDDIYFIPVRLDDCEVSSNISQFQWVDTSDLTEIIFSEMPSTT